MLDKKTVTTIKNIIYSHVDPKKTKIFIFGSWARGTGRKFSDIDIGLDGQTINSQILSNLEIAFEESDLPYTVDVVSFSHVSQNFKEVALQHVISLN